MSEIASFYANAPSALRLDEEEDEEFEEEARLRRVEQERLRQKKEEDVAKEIALHGGSKAPKDVDHPPTHLQASHYSFSPIHSDAVLLKFLRGFSALEEELHRSSTKAEDLKCLKAVVEAFFQGESKSSSRTMSKSLFMDLVTQRFGKQRAADVHCYFKEFASGDPITVQLFARVVEYLERPTVVSLLTGVLFCLSFTRGSAHVAELHSARRMLLYSHAYRACLKIARKDVRARLLPGVRDGLPVDSILAFALKERQLSLEFCEMVDALLTPPVRAASDHKSLERTASMTFRSSSAVGEPPGGVPAGRPPAVVESVSWKEMRNHIMHRCPQLLEIVGEYTL